MSSAKLRSVGGSVMVAIPPHMLEQLHLGPNANVELTVEGNRLVIDPKSPKGRIGFAARLAMCDFSLPMSEGEREWLASPRAGREEI
jgi:antitoxin ChpS